MEGRAVTCCESLAWTRLNDEYTVAACEFGLYVVLRDERAARWIAQEHQGADGLQAEKAFDRRDEAMQWCSDLFAGWRAAMRLSSRRRKASAKA